MSTALAKREENAQLAALAQIAEQRTPENEIRTRPGRGGKLLKYTDGAYVIRALNAAFAWDWDFVADNEELLLNNGEPFEVKVRGTLTVRLNGQAVTKTQFGCQPIEMLSNGSKPVSIGDAYKGAATDAMKKCASLLGIALDLYDSDSEVNTGKPKPPTPPPAPQQQRRPEPAQNVGPKTQEILDWIAAMGWDAATFADYIALQFRKAVDSADVVKAIGQLDGEQKKRLHQMIQSEVKARGLQ